MATQGIRVHATMTVKNAKDKDELLKLAKPLIEGTRKDEGCFLYELFEKVRLDKCKHMPVKFPEEKEGW